ncbi:hypothetical protein F3J45_23040 [Pantoea sp. Ap-967]|uniref:hypothetical protein n=1 Tax=Pantoea sp. Ap-967 TaxID=2608362 RepID=UPI0014201F09|nr:hypothetical protein [Pantoea sp. Ap-967]NIE77315.1 hypothetical protein [Pantoea sp. Ap-967]
MPNQNKEQAEQLIAEVLAAACLVVERDIGSAKDRSLAQRVLQCAQQALHIQKISVYSQAGTAPEIELPGAKRLNPTPTEARQFVMRKRGRQVVLDVARLRSYGTLINVGRWCKSALRSNLLRAFQILGQPEPC